MVVLDKRRDTFSMFLSFARREYPFLLESSMRDGRLGRFSIMGAEPSIVFESKGEEVRINGKRLRGNPFKILKELIRRGEGSLLPFSGGWIGFFSYDLGRVIEKLPSTARDDLLLPDIILCFYENALIVDEIRGKVYPVGDEDRLLKILSEEEHIGDEGYYNTRVVSNFTKDGYIEAVERAKRYIVEGDIFQVNLSQRFEAPLPFSPLVLYKRLRRINPAPFSCYLDYGDFQVVGSSPERFLKLDGRKVETRPIKGTRRRGLNDFEDRALAMELLESEKDRAENVMIVDLERNDLGKVCEFGSVRVKELCILEKYPTVFHLVSTVEGVLREGLGPIDLIEACFPGGSITGAPKIRAMEIIEELEPTRRGIYTGSIGYISADFKMDLNIVIRTFVIKDGVAYFQAGGGIVYDSDPVSEYEETLHKAKALFEALGLKVETVEAHHGPSHRQL